MSLRLRPALLSATALAATVLAGGSALAQAALSAGAAAAVEGVVVTGARETTSAATGLNLSLRETPQSVTVVTRGQIEDFGLTTASDLLALVPGVNVEKVETDRTYYNARGFDITSFQLDGVALPLIWGIQFGDLDTILFERVEAVRGANAMRTGTGNPSAAINYVRKRPTDAFQASAAIQYGSWEDRRIEADVSGPINRSGTLKGRLVYANEDKGSYLDHYGVNRNVYHGVLSWQATPSLTLTGGYSHQDNRARGVLWGALPLNYADGGRIDFPVSASTSADWTFWNVRDQTAFAEAHYQFANGWQAKGVVTYKRFDEYAKLLYAFGNPDRDTGLGVFGMTGLYPSLHEHRVVDVEASGPFNLFGRSHQLVVGAHASQSDGKEYEDFYGDYPAYPAVGLWGSEQVAEPAYPGRYLAADQTDRMSRAFAAAHLDFSDRLKGVAGVNLLKLKSSGYSYGTETPRDESAASPYAGLVFDLTPQVSLYASYTDIFNPQSEVDIDHLALSAAHGESYEAGLKSEWFDKRLYVTASVFKAQQSGLAEFAGVFDNGKSYYVGVDTFVTGYEFEVAGALTERWTVNGGWTQMKVRDADDHDTRTYLPRKTLKLSTTYSLPSLRGLKLGAAVRWQDEVSVQDIVLITQKAYAVVDLMAGVDLTDRVRATLNIKNVGDETYLTSLLWNQSYYAAPRSYSLRLQYAF